MAAHVDPHHVLTLTRSDAYPSHRLRAFNGAIRIEIPGQPFEITFRDGVATTMTSGHESPARALLPGWARLYDILQNAAGGTLSNATSA